MLQKNIWILTLGNLNTEPTETSGFSQDVQMNILRWGHDLPVLRLVSYSFEASSRSWLTQDGYRSRSPDDRFRVIRVNVADSIRSIGDRSAHFLKIIALRIFVRWLWNIQWKTLKMRNILFVVFVNMSR